MKLQELIDKHLKNSPYTCSSSHKSSYQIACEFVKGESLQYEEISEEIVQFIDRFAKGDALTETDFNSFYENLNKNFKIYNAVLSVVNEIAMDIYDQNKEEIQGFVAEIEGRLSEGKPLSFPNENAMEKYRALLNNYCLVKAKKLPITYDSSHFCRYGSRDVVNLEIPFAINTLTLMNLLPKEGSYCGITMGEPIYPNFKDRKAKKEIPLDRKGIKDWKLYFPFKHISKIGVGETGDNTFVATNGKKTLFIRGSLSAGTTYIKDDSKTSKTRYKTYSGQIHHYNSKAIMASKIATFVSREHFSSERALSNNFSGSKKHPNYVLSYAKKEVKEKFNNDDDVNPGAGFIDEVLGFLWEKDPNIENYGFSTDRVEDIPKSVVCKIDFDYCNLVTPTTKEEYQKNRFTGATSNYFKKTSQYYQEQLYSRLKLAVMSREFILALAEKAYPEKQQASKEVIEPDEQLRIIDEKLLVIEEIVRRTNLALNLFLESCTQTTANFLRNNLGVFNRILQESIEYIQKHFSEQDQPKLIESIEKRIQFIKKEVENKLVPNLNKVEKDKTKKIKLKPLLSAKVVLANISANINADTKTAAVPVVKSSKEEEEDQQTKSVSNAPNGQIRTTSENSRIEIKPTKQNDRVIPLHNRTAAFLRDVKKEIEHIEKTPYGDPDLKQNKLAVLKFLQDCAKKINPMNFSAMIEDVCECPIKGLDTFKKEIEADYNVTLNEIELVSKTEIAEKQTIYSLLSTKGKIYKSSFFEFFNDSESKSKQLIDKYKKPDTDEKYGEWAAICN